MPGPETGWEWVSSGSPGVKARQAQERGHTLPSEHAVKHHLWQVLVSS